MSGYLREKVHARIAELESEKAELLSELAEMEDADAKVATPLAEFVDEDTGPMDWLIEDVLAPGTINMIAADPACGKTALLTQLTLCLAAGRQPFYNCRVPKPRRCLYIAAEGSRTAFQGRLRTTMRTMGIGANETWWIQAQGHNDYKFGSPGLERLVKTTNAEFCVCDTVGYFWRGDENDASLVMERVFQPLRRLSDQTNCAFMLVHHNSKSTEAEGWRRMRGSVGWQANSDLVLSLSAADGDTTDTKRILLCEKQKYGVPRSWALTFDKTGARFG